MKTKFGVSFTMHPERIFTPEEMYAFRGIRRSARL